MAPPVVIERSFARLLALEANVERYRDRYEDREDLAGARLLIDALALAIADAQQGVMREWRAAAGEPDPLTTSLLHTMVRGIEFQVGRCLDAIHQEHGRAFDPLAEPYLRMARALEPDAEIIFRPSETPRYSLSRSLLRPLINGLRGRRSQLAPRLDAYPTLVYLRYPVAEERNVLQHLLIAHELAHLALRSTVGADLTLIDEIVDPVFRTWREKHLAGEPPPRDAASVDAASEEDPHIQQASTRITNWLTELACDVLAMHLVGPAYLLALREHAALRSLTYRAESDELESHPHLAWRLEILGEYVDNLLPVRKEDGRRDKIWLVAEQAKKGIPEWRSRTPSEIVGAVETGLKTVAERMPTILQDAAFTREGFDAAVDLVWDKLRDGISPAEHVLSRTGAENGTGHWDGESAWSRPLDWRQIINVAYFRYFVTQIRDVDPGRGIEGWRDLEEDRQELHDEVRGAIELSELQRLAQKLQTRLGALDTPRSA